jgi:hypothetical protein
MQCQREWRLVFTCFICLYTCLPHVLSSSSCQARDLSIMASILRKNPARRPGGSHSAIMQATSSTLSTQSAICGFIVQCRRCKLPVIRVIAKTQAFDTAESAGSHRSVLRLQSLRAQSSSSSCYQSSHSINAIDPASHWSGRSALNACQQGTTVRMHAEYQAKWTKFASPSEM